MEYKVIPITLLEHATWDLVKDGHYVVPIGFPDQTSKESKYIDIWQLQDTINVTQIIDLATDQRAGLMSAEDKEKLDTLSIEATLNNNIINGEAVGSLRIIGSSEEEDDYSLGQYAFAEGLDTKASGDYSHAEGDETVASGDYSHAEGSETVASGNGSHAEGENTTASGGGCSHAEGLGTIATAIGAHAEGVSTIASGSGSHAGGSNTVANSLFQTAIGEFNIIDTAGDYDTKGTYAFIIGNGTRNDERSNACTVDWQGNIALQGNAYVNNSISENNKLVTQAELNSIGTVEATDIGYTITTAGETILKNISNTPFLDLIYPVGSIYMSMNTDNPSTLFGGVWQSLAQGKMLLGADEENYITGDPNKGSGGSKDAVLVEHTHQLTRSKDVTIKNHTVSITQPTFTYPSHSHNMGGNIWSKDSGGTVSAYTKTTKRKVTSRSTNTDGGGSCKIGTKVGVTLSNHEVTQQPVFTNDTQGVSGTNANLPPYLVVNMWQRIE